MIRRCLLRGVLGVLVVFAVLFGLAARADRPAAEVEARWGQAPSKFLVVDGLRAHYRDRGQGPVVVLLHGSNASLYTWEGWVSDLSRDHRVVTLDLPGHGLTGPDPKHRYSRAGMASFVDAFTTQLGLARFTVGGNSMGGGVAWELAVTHPEKVERLILVDSAGMPVEEPRTLGFRLYASPVTGHLVRWATPRFLIGRTVRETYGDPSKVTDGLVDLYEDILLRDGNREATRERFADGAAQLDATEARLADVRVPTLILWGARDRWLLPKYGERFHAAIPGSRLVVLDGLGHVPMEEDPLRTVAVAREFLGAGDPAIAAANHAAR
jgi:pimeloyl-ACP methyl ester carboxylesterase